MPLLEKDLIIKDALSTNMFQLFLVIHHWDNTEVFDNVVLLCYVIVDLL